MSKFGFWDAIAIVVGIFAWTALVLSMAAATNKFHLYLKSQHPGTWKALGMPELVVSPLRQYAGSNRLQWFLLRRKYRNFGDPELARLGNRALLFICLFLVVGICGGVWWTFS